VPINKNKIKKILTGLVWTLTGISCIWLLVSAVHSKDAKRCKGVDITISGVSNNFFIDKGDVYAIIKSFGGDSTARKSLAAIDLGKIEHALEKDVWIKNAELFFDNNDRLKVSVEEREPIARVFSITGNTFYIDSSCMMLPLSDKFSARVPVFTGFTSDARILSKADSALLRDVKVLGERIAADSFLMAMIDQVDITAQRTFEMVHTTHKTYNYESRTTHYCRPGYRYHKDCRYCRTQKMNSANWRSSVLAAPTAMVCNTAWC
jgi:cell division protein FtsQ